MTTKADKKAERAVYIPPITDTKAQAQAQVEQAKRKQSIFKWTTRVIYIAGTIFGGFLVYETAKNIKEHNCTWTIVGDIFLTTIGGMISKNFYKKEKNKEEIFNNFLQSLDANKKEIEIAYKKSLQFLNSSKIDQLPDEIKKALLPQSKILKNLYQKDIDELLDSNCDLTHVKQLCQNLLEIHQLYQNIFKGLFCIKEICKEKKLEEEEYKKLKEELNLEFLKIFKNITPDINDFLKDYSTLQAIDIFERNINAIKNILKTLIKKEKRQKKQNVLYV